jgi:hypothetical protein
MMNCAKPRWLWEDRKPWLHAGSVETLLLRLVRERGLSFAEIARQAVPETSQQQVERLAKGQRRLGLEWGRRLEPALGVAPQDLCEGRIRRVRLEIEVAISFTNLRGSQFHFSADTQKWIEAPEGLEAKEECFAARVADDSAARLYPKGSTLFVRRMAHLGGVLQVGAKVLARFRDALGRTSAVLAGRISETPVSDLVLFTASTDSEVPESLVLRRHATAPRAVSERFLPYRTPAEAIEYEPQISDLGEVLGIVEYATTPERV